jgi:chemosensory pili system protein ChpA (sensor histidine kinase/response regulator)
VPEVSLTAAERRAARIEDEIDEQVLPLFLEESVDLMRDIGELCANGAQAPDNAETARILQRALHTLKGSARMAGAMGCGELLHSMEDRVDQAIAMKSVQADHHRRAGNLLRPYRDADRASAQSRGGATGPGRAHARGRYRCLGRIRSG